MDFMTYMTNPEKFHRTALNSLAGAGFPPVKTPSCACANCGKLVDHKDGQVPMEAMDGCKMCSVCKSYTYILCSNKCLKADRKRHAADCRARRDMMKVGKEQQEKEESRRRMEELRWFASEGRRPGDSDQTDENRKMLNDLFSSDDATNLINEQKADADRLREENCTVGLKLRNAQLEHATEMYKERQNLDAVGPPPHVFRCNNCGKRANFDPKSFQTDMARCGRCLLVRYCSVSCQKQDRKKHKGECRDGRCK